MKRSRVVPSVSSQHVSDNSPHYVAFCPWLFARERQDVWGLASRVWHTSLLLLTAKPLFDTNHNACRGGSQRN